MTIREFEFPKLENVSRLIRLSSGMLLMRTDTITVRRQLSRHGTTCLKYRLLLQIPEDALVIFPEHFLTRLDSC